jgi:transporter family-2 protein
MPYDNVSSVSRNSPGGGRSRARGRESHAMDRGVALLLTLATGALIAFQPPSNALLARHVGDLGAAFVSLIISTIIVGCLLLATSDAGALGGLSDLRPPHVIGGIGGAAIVVVTIVAVRPLGAAGVVAALVTTQLITSLVIDKLGLLDVTVHGLTPTRVAGAALLIAGLFLVTMR